MAIKMKQFNFREKNIFQIKSSTNSYICIYLLYIAILNEKLSLVYVNSIEQTGIV